MEWRSGIIYRSTNNGTSWDLVLATASYTSVPSLIIIDSNIFAGTSGISSGVLRSSNNGTTWAVDDTIFRGGGGTRAFVVIGTNLFAGTNTGVYLSTNSGLSWSPVNNGLPDYVNNYGWITTLAVSPNGAGGNNLFAGTDTAGVYLSTNNGTSWTAIGMTNSYVNALVVSGTSLFVVTYSQIWRRPLSDITGVEDQSNEIPTQFILEQNYPNPFNPTTTIGYVLQEKNNTKLTLINVIGEEVAILVNEEQDKGYHTVTLNAANLPSGVYLYKLQAGNFIETKKMLLLK